MATQMPALASGSTALGAVLSPIRESHEGYPGLRHRRKRRKDWRQGGRTVRRWDASLLSFALAGLGLGLVAGPAIRTLGLPWSPSVSTLYLWVGMGVVVLYAATRSIPAGLLRFRPIDLMWGTGLGLGLRLLQGWTGGSETLRFPSLASGVDAAPSNWWSSVALSASVIGPIVEESFFRGVVLVTVYQMFRRGVGVVAAGLTALLVSSGGFVLVHFTFQGLTPEDGLQLFAVGAACAAAVLLTGRIWAALLIHVVYNGSFLVLALLGTVLA